MEALAFSLIACLLVGIACMPSVIAQGPWAVRIACGATVDTYGANGFLWSKDWGYSGGRSANVTVNNHKASQLNTVRYFQLSGGGENCYNITVPVGHYLIRLYFTFGQEDNASREPQFDVSIEGTLVYSLLPGWSSDDNNYQDSLAFVNDGAATICFHSSGHGNPAVASIEVLQIFNQAYNRGFNVSHEFIMRSVKRVSAGAEKSGFGSDFLADPWGGDRYWESDISLFLPGSAVNPISTNLTINNAAVYPNIYPQAIFQTATSANPGQSLSYTLPVEPNLEYSIWFYFAELATFVDTGDRVFDVLVNEQKVFANVDIMAWAQGAFSALILNTTVLVEGKTLTVTFNPIIGNIAVNAFEVYALVPTEVQTLNTNLWAIQELKQSLNVPARLGWNGDPCVPQLHPWNGVDCRRSAASGFWMIEGLNLDSQGLRGVLGEEIGALTGLEHLNLSHNMLQGLIPVSIGQLESLLTLDLSYNLVNGSIPSSLGNLTKLQKLFLNNNLLSGEVPHSLSAGALRGANLNIANNEDLCGVGIKPCGHLKGGTKAGIIVGVLLGSLLAALAIYIFYKRRQNIARAQRLPRDAPYAKARTTFVRDVQLARTVLTDHFRPVYRDPTVAPGQTNPLL
ncbi:receptor-like protein 4 [Physcomitrium patens]|uniref:Malectin-like domain-containing protein n=1 Tax=Physcomitrium patens TaxID=3218 RepID=A0A2K1IAV7_PHYPA|nr:receptor like protein 4-like [Physcomitrium patens]XP_024367593.1 receptor like protein 4-like [Physcomitrium patens]XP_024367594.1 receptor like protein 4-like [Physcomitrium patens]XP_024367595.1 receptor like protein 4-like [Physcomitrium patens]XP_024367596.1 receptor like protein 4-like [Physcomitrium patens]XP_024367597.1 receptor like protein 4-like [Physcomitrium patens]XP_024367598.1 receptor like protein 4-like [Physcomitrium patens]PNR26411.1 hypothetical protein PHYPA_030986 [|eukprot:XP_024367592.1 receptor like protein 4-like [Physcomitrella patens]